MRGVGRRKKKNSFQKKKKSRPTPWLALTFFQFVSGFRVPPSRSLREVFAFPLCTLSRPLDLISTTPTCFARVERENSRVEKAF